MRKRFAFAFLPLATSACSPELPEPDREERLKWEAAQANRAAEAAGEGRNANDAFDR